MPFSLLVIICMNPLFTAAFSLSFFGLLRVGEVTVCRLSDVSKIIQNTDVTFTPFTREVKIRIKYSKTDQYGKSFQICIEKADNATICPVLSLIAFLRIRPQFSGPFFWSFEYDASDKNLIC